MERLPSSHFLSEPITQLLRLLLTSELNGEELMRTLQNANRKFPASRALLVEEVGEELQKSLEISSYFLLNQIIFLLEYEVPLPNWADNLTEGTPKKRPNFPKSVVTRLEAWLKSNPEDPYPTQDQKLVLCQELGLSLKQVNDWFINARRRKLERSS